MRIGIDLLGSETPPTHLYPAILQAAQKSAPGIIFEIFATPNVIQELFLFPSHPNIRFQEVENEIVMSDSPLLSIRRKKNSSLSIGMQRLKDKHLDAFVTAGNTGAVIACAALILNKLPQIKRPALLAAVPTLKNPLTILDFGGSTVCRAEYLVQFALLGSAYHQSTTGQKKSRLALLNIGVELTKGTQELQKTYSLLKELAEKQPTIEFHGNVEARDIFSGELDVLVTDGFTGNVLLKTSEGVSSLIFSHIYSQNVPEMKTLAEKTQQRFNYEEHPGAIVIGVDGLLVKCHGAPSQRSFFNAIQGAVTSCEQQLVDRMKGYLGNELRLK